MSALQWCTWDQHRAAAQQKRRPLALRRAVPTAGQHGAMAAQPQAAFPGGEVCFASRWAPQAPFFGKKGCRLWIMLGAWTAPGRGTCAGPLREGVSCRRSRGMCELAVPFRGDCPESKK